MSVFFFLGVFQCLGQCASIAWFQNMQNMVFRFNYCREHVATHRRTRWLHRIWTRIKHICNTFALAHALILSQNKQIYKISDVVSVNGHSGVVSRVISSPNYRNRFQLAFAPSLGHTYVNGIHLNYFAFEFRSLLLSSAVMKAKNQNDVPKIKYQNTLRDDMAFEAMTHTQSIYNIQLCVEFSECSERSNESINFCNGIDSI